MTIINNIEIDDIEYNINYIKDAVNNNCPIEPKLHVIAVISNPCLYATRYILMREFIKRMELDENDVVIHIRSGDIFNKCPHPVYIMPPLSYYVNILIEKIFDLNFLKGVATLIFLLYFIFRCMVM